MAFFAVDEQLRDSKESGVLDEVPAERVVTALSGGPGAAIILQRTNDAAR